MDKNGLYGNRRSFGRQLECNRDIMHCYSGGAYLPLRSDTERGERQESSERRKVTHSGGSPQRAVRESRLCLRSAGALCLNYSPPEGMQRLSLSHILQNEKAARSLQIRGFWCSLGDWKILLLVAVSNRLISLKPAWILGLWIGTNNVKRQQTLNKRGNSFPCGFPRFGLRSESHRDLLASPSRSCLTSRGSYRTVISMQVRQCPTGVNE